MSTPDHVLTQKWEWRIGPSDTMTLPPGTFVRPIEIQYVPKHVLEDDKWKFFGASLSGCVYCYSSLGIIPVSLDIIRRCGE